MSQFLQTYVLRNDCIGNRCGAECKFQKQHNVQGRMGMYKSLLIELVIGHDEAKMTDEMQPT